MFEAKFLAVCALMAIVATRSPRSANASSTTAGADEACSWIFLCSGGGTAHIADGGDKAVKPTHAGCMICSGGVPADCHDYCQVSLRTADSATVAMYRLALEAAKRSDATKLMTLAADIPDYAHYNEQRHAVQLLDCQSKNVIVSLPFELRGGSLAARAN